MRPIMLRAGRRGGPGSARTALPAAVLAVAVVGSAVVADPVNEQVVHGNVVFIRDGHRTIIQASDGSIINYFSFDIAPHEIVQFIQPHHLARVLNRINGPTPTIIQGQLLANGQVYLVNSSGVMFSGSAVVDVGGLHAAAGSLSNDNFLEGTDRFTSLTGSVVNHGTINAGQVSLVGRNVANHGAINAQGGLVAMVAGEDVLLRRHGDRIQVKVDGSWLTDRDRPMAGATMPDMAATPGVENTGTISAAGGGVLLGAGDHYALALRNQGTIDAAGGSIEALAADGLVHNQGVLTVSADQGPAGSITVQAPSIVNDGLIAADAGPGPGAAGSIEVTSHRHTYLRDGSVISAAGGEGVASGGDVLVHSYDGQTVLATDAVIDVSGGGAGGDGGFAEVSGRNLIFNGHVRLEAAPGGAPGTLLLDPGNIVIGLNGADDGFLDDGQITFDEGGTEETAVISAATLAALQGDILLQSSGTIFVIVPVALVHENNVLLEANTSILIGAPFIGARDIIARADADGDGVGGITVKTELSLSGMLEFTGNNILLHGATIISGGEQVFNGAVNLGFDTELAAAHVHFNGTVDSTIVDEGPLPARGLTITGPVTFDGAVGAANPLLFLRVDGAVELNGGAVVTRLGQTYGGPVTLGADADLISLDGGDLVFQSTIDGQGHDLSITAPYTAFLDEVRNVGILTTDGGGAGDTTVIGADVTAQGIDLGDAVRLIADATITGVTFVNIDGTIDGPHALTLSTEGNLRLGDDVGAGAALAYLETNVGGIMIVDGTRIEAEGDIVLNPAGRAGVPQIATIAGRGGDLVIRSLGGDVRVGQHEKITALGDLTIDAAGGTATLGDLNSGGALRVVAQVIELLTRDPGLVLTASGRSIGDRGLDIVAIESIDFSVSPVLVGGKAPPIIATASGGNVSNTLNGFLVQAFPGLALASLRRGATVLDLAPFTKTNPVEAKIGPLPPIDDPVLRDPLTTAALDRLAIYVRALTAQELATITTGHALYDDLAAAGEVTMTSAGRLDRRAVMEVLARYAALLMRDPYTAATLDTEQPQQAHIRGVLAEAWRAYGDETRRPTAEGFRSFLADRHREEALAYLDGLQALFLQVRATGVTPRELQQSLHAVLDPLRPPGMTTGVLEEAIGAGRAGT